MFSRARNIMVTSTQSTVDLENPDQLPVKEVFEGILMSVSQILS